MSFHVITSLWDPGMCSPAYILSISYNEDSNHGMWPGIEPLCWQRLLILRRMKPCKDSIIINQGCGIEAGTFPLAWEQLPGETPTPRECCHARPAHFPQIWRQLCHRSYSSSNSVSMGELVSCHPLGLLSVWEVVVIGAPAPVDVK